VVLVLSHRLCNSGSFPGIFLLQFLIANYKQLKTGDGEGQGMKLVHPHPVATFFPVATGQSKYHLWSDLPQYNSVHNTWWLKEKQRAMETLAGYST